jgi:hypothetical protein
MSALQEVKANAGAIEKLKSSSPAAYDAVKDVIQAMIQMAESMAKSENEELGKALPSQHPLFNENHLNSGNYAVLSGQNPKFPEAVQTQGGNEALENEIKAKGWDYHPVAGMYDGPESSFVVHNPDIDAVRDLGSRFGQESVLLANGGKNKLLFTNGPNAGKYHAGEGVKMHNEGAPENYYSTYLHNGNPIHWTNQIDFSQLHDDNVAKSELRKDSMPALQTASDPTLMADLKAHLNRRTTIDPPDPHKDWMEVGHKKNKLTGRALPNQPEPMDEDWDKPHTHQIPVKELLNGIPHAAFKSKELPGQDMHVIQGPSGGYRVSSQNGFVTGIGPHDVNAEGINSGDTNADLDEYIKEYHPKVGRYPKIRAGLDAQEAKAKQEADAEAARQAALLAAGPAQEDPRVAAEKAKPLGGVFGVLGQHNVTPINRSPAVAAVAHKKPNIYGAGFTGPGAAYPANSSPAPAKRGLSDKDRRNMKELFDRMDQQEAARKQSMAEGESGKEKEK